MSGALDGCGPVVVVDPNRMCLTGLNFLLIASGYDVLAFANGAAACAALARIDRPPLAVVTDVDICGACTGPCLIESVRARFGPVPAIVLTADTSSQARQRLAALDAHILFKPMPADGIVGILEELRRAACAAAAPARINGTQPP